MAFALMPTKVDSSFLGCSKWKKTDIGAILRFKPHFCQSVAWIPPNLQKRCVSAFHTILPNFKPNLSQENFIWEKNKISTWCLSTFQALFLVITYQPVRLAAFPRSVASVQLPEHFEPFDALLSHCRVLCGSNSDLEVTFITYAFGPTDFSLETAQIEFFRTYPVFAHSGGRRSAKTGWDRLDWMRCAFFCIYSGFC